MNHGVAEKQTLGVPVVLCVLCEVKCHGCTVNLEPAPLFSHKCLQLGGTFECFCLYQMAKSA